MNPQDYLKAICSYLPYGVEVQWLREDDNKFITSTLTISDYDFLIRKKKGKLLLTPLSEINKEIDVNGEKFNPFVELAKISGFEPKKYIIDVIGDTVIMQGHNPIHPLDSHKSHRFFELDLDDISFDYGVFYENGENEFYPFSNQLKLFEKLYEWRFDVGNLIENGYALDKTKLK